jgi:hypothetical protein
MTVEEQREELGHATDRLNASIAEAERCLTDLNPGVSASVPIEEGPNGTKLLAFRKDNRRWALCLVIDGEASPLRNATREDRIRAVPFLPALHTALLKSVGSEIDKVEQAISEVQTFIAGLEKP